MSDRNDRSAFLQSLSSGQLLCVAYNAGVRRSRKPWGYISKDSIHDILGLQKTANEQGGENDKDDKGKRMWTFRRSDNLRLWAGCVIAGDFLFFSLLLNLSLPRALKLRYLVPVVGPTLSKLAAPPSSPSASHTPTPFRTSEPPINFDIPIVARTEEGWEDMLEGVLLRWVKAVVDEQRQG